MEINARCAARHYGPWLIDLMWLHQSVALIQAGILQPWSTTGQLQTRQVASDENGLAVVQIVGQMMKGESKYGGTNTLDLRRDLRQLKRDPDTKGVLLVIDSPGGTAAGTSELAADVRELAQEKPVHAHIEDLGASAAYWVASQADRITANESAQVGSIGTMAAVVDSSGAAEAEGIKVHVLSTGAYKGVGVPGAPISEDQLGHLQERVEDMNELFLRAVSEGRGVPAEKVDEWASGKVWIATKAHGLGLIDGVSTLQDAAQQLRESIPADKPTKTESLRLRLKMLRLSLDLSTQRIFNTYRSTGRAEA